MYEYQIPKIKKIPKVVFMTGNLKKIKQWSFNNTHNFWSVGEVQIFGLALQFLFVLLGQFHIAHSQSLDGLQHCINNHRRRYKHMLFLNKWNEISRYNKLSKFYFTFSGRNSPNKVILLYKRNIKIWQRCKIYLLKPYEMYFTKAGA